MRTEIFRRHRLLANTDAAAGGATTLVCGGAGEFEYSEKESASDHAS